MTATKPDRQTLIKMAHQLKHQLIDEIKEKNKRYDISVDEVVTTVMVATIAWIEENCL